MSTSFREDVAWAAGFFDGEGGIYYYPDGSGRYTVSARIGQKDPELLCRFASVVGVGNIYGPYGSSVCHSWVAGNFEAVQHVVATLWFFLGPTKRDQAAMAFKALRG